MSESRRGFLFGVAAYGMWGAFPLYWPLLDQAGAVEILMHRMLWSSITMALLVWLLRRRRQFVAMLRSRRAVGLLSLAAATISVNWGTYIWAVNNSHVVEASLGYFINPLVSVLMGIVVLGERLRPVQWAAMAVAASAVVVLTVDHGRPPWVALVLACTFGTYGLMKKLAGIGAVESLTFETLLIAPVAAVYLWWLASRDQSSFLAQGPWYAALFASTGIVTAIPLICFGAAAIRVSMTTLGLLQYLAPILQFALGVLWFHEAMPQARWLGFLLVWVALVAFTVEAYQHHRRQLRIVAESLTGA